MELIPIKEKIDVLELIELGKFYLNEHERLIKVLKAVAEYGTVLTTEDIVKLLEYKEKSELYLEFINHVEEGIIYSSEGLDNLKAMVISEVTLELISEIKTIDKILNHVKTSRKAKLNLENISSENSLLGILLESLEDSKFSSKEEVIDVVKQEIKQLENNSLIEVTDLDELEEGV